ncbi:MAG TPA: hypothetical protein VGJ55_19275, partial [Pyrinomonadaceae bacterium]
ALSRSGSANPPTKYLPEKSPLNAFEDAPRRRRRECVDFNTNFGADLVHGFGNMIWRVPSNVLRERVAE